MGLLSMRTEGIDGVVPGNDFSVVRVNQELPNRSAIGMMFVERQGDGQSTAILLQTSIAPMR